MSGRMMERALDASRGLQHAPARVLFVLARYANDDGSNCFPSLETIAAGSNMLKRAVIRCIAQLSDARLVEEEKGGGRGRVSRYRLTFGSAPKTVTPRHPKGAPKGDTVSSFKVVNGDSASLFPAVNGDIESPFEALKGDMVSVKGDMVSPDSNKTLESRTTTLSPVGSAPPLCVVASRPVAGEPRRVVEPKGSRLPPDWQPSGDMRLFANGLGLDCRATADKFRDHWHSQPGAKGRKLDWTATWRNWCREDERRAQRPTAPRKQSRMDRWREMMAEEDGPTINGRAEAFRPFLVATGD